VKDSPNGSFEVGDINRDPQLPPWVVGHSAKAKNSLVIHFLSSLSSLPKIHSWFLFLREDLSSLECATLKQEHLTLSLNNLIAFVTLRDWIPLMARVARELPRIVVKSREVCIVLLFMRIDSENQAGLCNNLGGLGLKETRLFVSSSTET
jgi:hypothetical protein